MRLPHFTLFSKLPKHNDIVVVLVWAGLGVALLVSLVTASWFQAFVALVTIGLTFLPVMFAERFQIKLPVGFFAWIALFIFGSVFLGESLDFYERYWWWDIPLHGGSAIAFGLVGFIFIFMLFQGDRYAAPPIAISFMAFCFAMTIGAIWEIFEFTMDFTFGLNMQKSGLVDTMTDLMVDAVGAFIGSTAGFFYLKGQEFGGLSGLIGEFVLLNRRYFKKRDRKER